MLLILNFSESEFCYVNLTLLSHEEAREIEKLKSL